MYTLNIYTFYFKNKIDLAFPPAKKKKKKNNKPTQNLLLKIGGGSGVERLYISPFFN